MSILRDLIDNMKTSDLVEQMRILTERIFEEESPDMEYIDHRPQGANIFLGLQIPGEIRNEVGFLCLERENEDLWLISFWTTPVRQIKQAIDEDNRVFLRKKRLHEIKDHRPEKILTKYAQTFKFYHGE